MLVALTGASGAPTAAGEAHALFAEYWDWQMREFPGYATAMGDHRVDDRLTDVSLAAIARRKAYQADLAARLRAVDRNDNALIDDGPLPMAVLERRIDEWIARSRQ